MQALQERQAAQLCQTLTAVADSDFRQLYEEGRQGYFIPVVVMSAKVSSIN